MSIGQKSMSPGKLKMASHAVEATFWLDMNLFTPTLFLDAATTSHHGRGEALVATMLYVYRCCAGPSKLGKESVKYLKSGIHDQETGYLRLLPYYVRTYYIR